ncbi:hypothetical protein LXL04_028543 [Taraxacum kok-saghyz]
MLQTDILSSSTVFVGAVNCSAISTALHRRLLKAVVALDDTLMHVIVAIKKQDLYRGRGKCDCYQNVLIICDFNMIFTGSTLFWNITKFVRTLSIIIHHSCFHHQITVIYVMRHMHTGAGTSDGMNYITRTNLRCYRPAVVLLPLVDRWNYKEADTSDGMKWRGSRWKKSKREQDREYWSRSGEGRTEE